MAQTALAVIAFGVLYLVIQTSKDRAEEKSRILRGQRHYTTLYPVFCEADIRSAETNAADATREANQLSRDVSDSAELEAAVAARQVSEELLRRAEKAIKARVEAEWLWHRHARMMDANASVVTGKATREMALAAADQAHVSRSATSLWLEASALIEDWKHRIEQGPDTAPQPLPHRFDNPWVSSRER